MNKTATLGFALLVFGSSAALAQSYGPGPYGGPDYYNQSGEHIVCGRNLAYIVNWIVDPASGRRITREDYQARYPWTDLSRWTYDCASNLWTDHTAEANPGYYAQDYRPGYYAQNNGPGYPAQDYGRYRGRDFYRR